MTNNDIKVILQDLPTTISGFVKETDDYYTIILNARMTHERNQKTYRHEKDHIDSNDFDRDCAADQIEFKSQQNLVALKNDY